ncbi:hypothetical protein [Desulfosporosinus hippei]|uniref:Uncharacterized protein n=1 Tax=Desulfosporosinus hippei DSM 8344 TaxID=1121419 RepID=A0A1G7UJF2_9FIRM|nr:hypothetical protein [Desulfosporosinus hippei]SDG47666.1 hypothetical protein SAMN05443529_103163 [Desulfosporosinus hippei DSM 8344]
MFKNLAAKSELSEGLAILDLQLFSEEFESTETTETEEVTEQTESTETEETTEETESEGQAKETNDVTQTQAFAHRLKEETSKAAQAARDAFIAEQGYEWNGKPITTEAEYKQALYEKQMHDAGQDPDTVKKLVDEHPDVKKAREEFARMESQRQIWSEYQELAAEHDNIKDPSQIPPEVWQLKNDKGITLLDAQNRIIVKNHKAQLEKIRLDTEQETLRKISKNQITSPGSASNGNVSHQTKSVMDMTAEEFEAYREEVKNRTRG